MRRITYLLAASLLVLTASAQIENLPKGFTLVNQSQSTEVKSQDRTGTCWSFSTSSFLESEILKRDGIEMDLSEIYTVRNIYLEKARNYIRCHGICNFSQGSLAHDVINSYEMYGMMPEEAYSGKNGQEKHNHSVLVKELKTFLDSIVDQRTIDPYWEQGLVNIMDRHLGEVPAVFDYNGKNYNARSFADEVLKLDMNDYVGFTSFTHHGYYENFIVEVPDNFSNGMYYNLPLDQLMSVLDEALAQGFTVEWDGDVSEVGFARRKGYAIYNNDTNAIKALPRLPREMPVTQELRQAKFDSHETTDDHLMHITGKTTSEDGRTFYIVKNSWGEKAGIDGHVLMSESYMRMKTISFYVNKAAVDQGILDQLKD